MNKNVVIFILVMSTLLGSIWGSIANRKRIVLKHQLAEMAAKMEKIGKRASEDKEQVLGKTADLKETLVEKDAQLQKARKELVALRKSSKAIESRLSECTASLKEMNAKKEAYLQEIQSAKHTITLLQSSSQKTGKEAVQPLVAKQAAGEKKHHGEVGSLQDKLQTASALIEQLREEANVCNAQLIGMEKLVDEKNASLDETSQEMDRLKINMDVLLSKIADQRDLMQEMEEDNRALVKELNEKNEVIADQREEAMRSTVRQE